jgi:thymidylate synthase
MQQYLDLLQYIIDCGVEKESGRANMPNTIGVSHGVIRMNLQDGFPLLTTKKMYWKGIVLELLWILKGETNIKYLVDNGVNIWNGDAYRWYQKWWNETQKGHRDALPQIETIEEFVENVKNNDNPTYLWGTKFYKLGDLGKVYGYQWRNQNGVDQVKEVLDGLKNNPYSRYHVIDAWNKSDFKDMALPPCHLMYQFIVRPMDNIQRTDLAWEMGLKEEYQAVAPRKESEWSTWLDEHGVPKFYLDLNMYQRSCDTLLGVPFNIASMSLLLTLFAKVSNMVAGVATWIGGDTHLYVNHIPIAKEQITRKPYDLPELIIDADIKSLEDILALTIDDFKIKGYAPHPAIKAELFTGFVKK